MCCTLRKVQGNSIKGHCERCHTCPAQTAHMGHRREFGANPPKEGQALGIFGRKRAAVAAVGLAALATASVANAAVMQQRPAASYQANGTVRKIIIVGNTAYLGGQFTAMIPSGGGTQVTRNHLAAVDMTTGGLLPWNPNANGTVYALLASGGNIYVGGSFTSVGGVPHKNLAEVDGTDGALVTSFANTTRPNKAVRALAVSPTGNLYVGGAFTSPRRFALETDATGALIPAWAPAISNTLGTSAEVRAIALNPSGTRVILGGFFNMLNSGAPGDPNATNLGVGAVDATTGASVSWAWHTTDLQTFRPFQLLAFAQDGSTLFGAGTGNGGVGHVLEHRDRRAQLHRGLQRQRCRRRRGRWRSSTWAATSAATAGRSRAATSSAGPRSRPATSSPPLTRPPARCSPPGTRRSTPTSASRRWPPARTPLAIGGEFTRVSGAAQQHFARFTE